jgi:isoleucyl-tRNA synthetase
MSKVKQNKTRQKKAKTLIFLLKIGNDTMDVWFDSGVSWYSVLQSNNISVPCDLYLEGKSKNVKRIRKTWTKKFFLQQYLFLCFT